MVLGWAPSTSTHLAQMCQSSGFRRTQEMSPQNDPMHRVEKVGRAAQCGNPVCGKGGVNACQPGQGSQ